MNKAIFIILAIVIVFVAIIVGIWSSQPISIIDVDVIVDPKDIIDSIRNELNK